MLNPASEIKDYSKDERNYSAASCELDCATRAVKFTFGNYYDATAAAPASSPDRFYPTKVYKLEKLMIKIQTKVKTKIISICLPPLPPTMFIMIIIQQTEEDTNMSMNLYLAKTLILTLARAITLLIGQLSMTASTLNLALTQPPLKKLLCSGRTDSLKLIGLDGL